MVTMTTAAQGLTRADLDSLRETTDDGRRYELLDGVILVTPSPSRRHQVVAAGLIRQQLGLGDAFRVLFAPLDVDLAPDTVVQPDLLVVDRDEFDDETRPVRPLLVIEVLSPNTRRIDQTLKRERYQRAGVPGYWLVDPTGPSVTVLELQDGTYVVAATASGDETADVAHPAPMTLHPASWLD